MKALYYITIKTPDCVNIKVTYSANNPEHAARKAIAYCKKYNPTVAPWYFKTTTTVRVKQAYTPRGADITKFTLADLGEPTVD